MVSRRKILSRSHDDLDLADDRDDDVNGTLSHQLRTRGGNGRSGVIAGREDEEDVWYQKDKLYRDHIQEVLNKWDHIDDEIWAKVIVMERNRRVAKAYARAPVLTVNGSDDGFDGYRIGLRGFDSGTRDREVDEVKKLVGLGVKFKMDEAGNILVKRVSRHPVLVMNAAVDETAAASDVLKLPRGALPLEKAETLFDVRKFRQNVDRELKRAYPDRRKLENQCISAISFVHGAGGEMLECPVWVMLINVVAMDMLKAKLPPMKRPPPSSANKLTTGTGSSEEDPYSLSGSATSGSSSSGKDLTINRRHNGSGNGAPRPDSGYSSSIATMRTSRDNLNNNNNNTSSKDFNEDPDARIRQLRREAAALKNGTSNGLNTRPNRNNDDVVDDGKVQRSSGGQHATHTSAGNKKKDDPYYCGLRAKTTAPRERGVWAKTPNGNGKNYPTPQQMNNNNNNNQQQRRHPAFYSGGPPHVHQSRSFDGNTTPSSGLSPFYPLKTGGLVGANPANRLLHHSRTVPAILDEHESEWENLWES